MLASHDDTTHLVKLAQAGDIESFALLVQYYQSDVYGYLTALLGDREEASDFTQQTFIKAWLSLAGLKSACCFKAWLYTIARRLTYDHWRSRRTASQSWESLDGDNIVENVAGLEDRIAEAELVNLTLEELSPKLRQCLLLGVVDGFPHDEIARIVGIGETSVSTYISSARRQFRDIYQYLQN
jgi:RNA polymerase sigma-70 factor (ECF subfamily)